MKHRGRDLRAALSWSIAFAIACSTIGCRVHDTGNAAYGVQACETHSYRGFCLTPDAGERVDARVDAALDAGDRPSEPSTEGEPCAPDNDEKLCYDGTDRTRAEGACISGVAKCVDGAWSACFGQVLPVDETCNGTDDDCDGRIDEDLSGDCTASTGCRGQLVCRKAHASCMAIVEPLTEKCNALDDDCDGNVDEDSDRTCIDDNAGCIEQADGIHCDGACTSGVQRCRDGALSACLAQVKPLAGERCDLGEFGIDDDCDGQADEDCPCSGSATRACYAASADPRTGATCMPGGQRCDDGAWGACEGAGKPSAETCPLNDVDDDCNGTVDDVPGEGKSCVSSHPGRCHTGTQRCVDDELRCVTPSAQDEVCNEIDDDCDGDTDEDFDLQEDRNHCGDCKTKCAEGRDCCAGACVDKDTSNDHCGSCGLACPSGTTCCGDGFCAALPGDRENCGTCGHVCGEAEQCCKGGCTDLLSDAKFCGTCQIACEPDTQSCVEGNCTPM